MDECGRHCLGQQQCPSWWWDVHVHTGTDSMTGSSFGLPPTTDHRPPFARAAASPQTSMCIMEHPSDSLAKLWSSSIPSFSLFPYLLFANGCVISLAYTGPFARIRTNAGSLEHTSTSHQWHALACPQPCGSRQMLSLRCPFAAAGPAADSHEFAPVSKGSLLSQSQKRWRLSWQNTRERWREAQSVR